MNTSPNYPPHEGSPDSPSLVLFPRFVQVNAEGELGIFPRLRGHEYLAELLPHPGQAIEATVLHGLGRLEERQSPRSDPEFLECTGDSYQPAMDSEATREVEERLQILRSHIIPSHESSLAQIAGQQVLADRAHRELAKYREEEQALAAILAQHPTRININGKEKRDSARKSTYRRIHDCIEDMRSQGMQRTARHLDDHIMPMRGFWIYIGAAIWSVEWHFQRSALPISAPRSPRFFDKP